MKHSGFTIFFLLIAAAIVALLLTTQMRQAVTPSKADQSNAVHQAQDAVDRLNDAMGRYEP